jgi:DNA mismatch endonuclease (patch repair protein)
MDKFSIEQRHRCMSKISGKNTRPEIIVRSLLHRCGYRFRLHYDKMPGKPDIVMPKYKTVIFVHGCFWHRHENCKRSTIPQTNTNFWLKKLNGNVQRDKLVQEQLQNLGWRVLVIWQCETKNLISLRERLLNVLK